MPPQLLDVKMPVKGEIALMLNLELHGAIVPVNGQLVITRGFSGDNGSIGPLTKSLIILAAKTLPPKNSLRSLSLIGYSSTF